jgi:uncharacterized protein (DUF58 family)
LNPAASIAARPDPIPRRTLRERLIGWAIRRQRIETREFFIGQHNIFILPSHHGLLYAAVTLIMLLCSVNYGISMGYLLTFSLVGIGVNALWRTHRNLYRLRLAKGYARPVYAGGEAQFVLRLHNPGPIPRHALHLEYQNRYSPPADVDAEGYSDVVLRVPALKRGWLRPGRFVLYTRFPLGLFRALCLIEFDMSVLVYPKPKPWPAQMQRGQDDRQGTKRQTGTEPEDFAGLREHRTGDSSRQIAWKIMARQERLLTKHFTSDTREALWLEWESLKGLDTEERLSILCHWVLEAETSSRDYGLRIPGSTLAPARGETHQRHCLETLALHGQPART